ncbi:MAG: sterol desaturase family protein [Desulfobacterales bacterium]|nr:sterol desaturase family protein [Desulfobacterales bacterium]
MELEKIKMISYWAGIVLWLSLELAYSYRKPSVSKLQRWLTNIPLSIVNGTVYYIVYYSSIADMLFAVSAKNYGLLNFLDIPRWLHFMLGILILDFIIYLWHLLNHEVPVLWRFHRVHHSDINMDVSSASRFHLGEILISGLIRLGVIYLFGVSFSSYLTFEIIVNAAIQFHHSSVRVNDRFEKIWMLLFVPPSMHRIHHSVKLKERDANYGVILSLWDRIMGTLVTDTQQSSINIGIGSHRDFGKLGFFQMMIMPFTKKSI